MSAKGRASKKGSKGEKEGDVKKSTHGKVFMDTFSEDLTDQSSSLMFLSEAFSEPDGDQIPASSGHSNPSAPRDATNRSESCSKGIQILEGFGQNTSDAMKRMKGEEMTQGLGISKTVLPSARNST